MAVAEIFLAASIMLLFEKLASGELSNFASREGIHPALKKWRRMLAEIEAVLADAEEKQIYERGIQIWLEDLEDLAYDLDDVLDEIATEALRRKLMHQEPPASTSKVRAFIPTCCTSLSPSTLLSDFRMKSKLDEITLRLQDLFERRRGLGLRKVASVASARGSQRTETTSLIHEPCVHGRDEDKKAIMDLLLNDPLSNTKFGVVPIVELYIQSCPKLLGKLPSNLPSLKTLKIMDCPQLVIEWLPSPTMPHGMRNTLPFDSLTWLSLSDVSIPCSFNSPEVADEACSHSRSSLTSMRLENIQELTCLPSWFLQGMMGLQELTISRCQNLTILWQNDVRLQHWLPALRRLEIEKLPPTYFLKLPRGLPSTLRTLFIDRCTSLQSLPELVMLNNLEKLEVFCCPALTGLCPGAGLPPTLKELVIYRCEKLEAVLAEGMTINCPSLESIDIRVCDNLKTLPDVIQNHDLRNLNWLFIEDCDNLESLPEGWFPKTNLRKLHITGCKKLDALPQSSYNKNNHLTSLQLLDTAAGIASYVLKEVRSLTNLTVLNISNIDKPPSEWGLHRLASLRELRLEDSSNALRGVHRNRSLGNARDLVKLQKPPEPDFTAEAD
ncbi:cyclic nucleotide gated channel 5 [Actinidia rufa]|uniref:Cyclic nucleotide gated channel 5 n=1 Tax=Actinidia rufa TaxID=165716 RepID=A0A7J0FV47_9ERIC|nr:cyclic nucleotide gated channel 5 [Actinidia rufa]